MATLDVTVRERCCEIAFLFPVLAVEVLVELRDTLGRLASDARPLPLVLTSAHPRIFLAGADLNEIAILDATSSASYADVGRQTLTSLRRYPSPTVVAVHGSCSGGGFDLVLACDAAVAHPDAVFSHPGGTRGLITGWEGTVRLPRAVGRARARRALLETRALTADELSRAGVVHTVCRNVSNEAEVLARQLVRIDSDRLRVWRALRDDRRLASFRALVTQGIMN